MSKGVITVTSEGVSVCEIVDNGWSEASLPATIEGLHTAARILAGWLDLPHEDLGDECRRIQYRDQSEAFLRDQMKEFLEGD
jgi:hypothetical protein